MKKLPTWLKALLIIIAVYLFAFQPIPYYVESPGRAFGLDDMVKIGDEYGENAGEFYLTTVGVQQVSPMTALLSIRPFHDLLSEQALFGDIQNFEAYDTIQQYYMESSGNTAIQVAFEAAGYPYELEFNGVYVLQVLEASDFAEELQVGDTVKAVDGNYFQSSHDFIDYISQRKAGDTVDILYEREGELHEAVGDLILLESGMPGIGIGLVDDTTLYTEPEVEIHAGGIGGPSAGLMFSLQIYNALVDGNLLGDYKIAGTGTIAPDGVVGRIGGIDKKIVAADDEGVDYFLAPDDDIPTEALEMFPDLQTNHEEAVEAAELIETDMEVIPIRTFSEAVEFLGELPQKEEATHTSSPPFTRLLHADDLKIALP